MIQSEFEIIQRYFVDSGLGFARTGVVLGIGDDAALLQLPSNRLLAISMDTLLAGVHFPAAAEPALIAQRALAVNLSDLAAMAATPLCFTLSLVLPESDAAWLQDFSEGLLGLAKKYACPLVGGDITHGELSITIQVQGTVDPDKVLRRVGAKVGDRIYVSGFLGDGAIALASLGIDSHLGSSFALNQSQPSESCAEYFKQAYYQPEPRIELAQACASTMTSGIDISDGLYGDLKHIITASGTGAQLRVNLFPYSDAAIACMSAENRQQAALYGGDDYELCFTVPPKYCQAMEQAALALNTRVTRVGEITRGSEIICIDASGSELPVSTKSYDHFGNH